MWNFEIFKDILSRNGITCNKYHNMCCNFSFIISSIFFGKRARKKILFFKNYSGNIKCIQCRKKKTLSCSTTIITSSIGHGVILKVNIVNIS